MTHTDDDDDDDDDHISPYYHDKQQKRPNPMVCLLERCFFSFEPNIPEEP